LVLIASNTLFAQKNYFFTPHQDIAFYKKGVYEILSNKKVLSHKKYNSINAIIRGINFLEKTNSNDALIGCMQTYTVNKFYLNKKFISLIDKYYEQTCNEYLKQHTLQAECYKNDSIKKTAEKKALINLMLSDSVNQNYTLISSFNTDNKYSNLLDEHNVKNFQLSVSDILNFNLKKLYSSSFYLKNHFLHNDTSYYYFNNSDTITKFSNLKSNQYEIDKDGRFTLLHINGYHYEWKFNKNGLPIILLKIPDTYFKNATVDFETIELIFINYKNLKPKEIYHYILNRGHNSTFLNFKDALEPFIERKSVLKNLEIDYNFKDGNFFSKNDTVYDKLNNFLNTCYKAYCNKYLYSYSNNGQVAKEIYFDLEFGNKLTGKYYYKNNLLKKIVYDVETNFLNKFKVVADYNYSML
jgi:hypothetical protein